MISFKKMSAQLLLLLFAATFFVALAAAAQTPAKPAAHADVPKPWPQQAVRGAKAGLLPAPPTVEFLSEE
jgi:hypothetical protein